MSFLQILNKIGKRPCHPRGRVTCSAPIFPVTLMSYAIFKTGGKQYRATSGDILEIEKLEGEAGAKITFNDVLLAGEGSNIRLGDALKGASVSAEIVDQMKGPKLLAYKYRRRKGYHRTVGHRQKLTKVKITAIP